MFSVTYDSNDRGGVFSVHLDRGAMEKILHSKGLHYLDLEKYKNIEILMTMTTRDNYVGHTIYEIRKAIEARKLQGMMGHP